MRSATVGWPHTATESVVVQLWRADYITRYGHRGMSADALMPTLHQLGTLLVNSGEISRM